jgi:hypothetical protein
MTPRTRSSLWARLRSLLMKVRRRLGLWMGRGLGRRVALLSFGRRSRRGLSLFGRWSMTMQRERWPKELERRLRRTRAMRALLRRRAESIDRCWVSQRSRMAELEHPLVEYTVQCCRHRQLLALMARLRCRLLHRPRRGRSCCCRWRVQCMQQSSSPCLSLRCCSAQKQGTCRL